MNESNISITSDFTKFFKAWVTINITSVYTNMLSFYEVASKLIVNLNNLKKTQNNSSDQMDSMVTQTEEYITQVRGYLNSWKANIESEWQNFLQDRTEYEQNFLAQLKETYDNFITELQQMETNFLEEIKNYWSGKTTIIENTAESGMNDLIAIYNRYKGKVDTWNTDITNDVNNAINDTKELMGQLQNKLTTFETEQKEIINSKNEEWKNLANNFYNEYKDVAKEKVDNTDLLTFVKSWGENKPIKFNQNGMIITIKYFGEETPSDMETNDLWYKPSMVNINGGLYKYNGTDWDVEALRMDKLYSYNNRLYYLTTEINQDIIFNVPINPTSVYSVISYHDNILYMRIGHTIYECNLETKTVTNTWENVNHLDNVNTRVIGNHTDIFTFANNKYYFGYSDNGNKFYYVNSIQDFVNQNFNEIEQNEGYDRGFSYINGGYRNNYNFVPLAVKDQFYSQEYATYNAINRFTYLITLKGFDSNDAILGTNTKNEFLLMSGSGIGSDGYAILENGYGSDIWCELNNIYSKIGFAPKNSFMNNQQYTYQDDIVGDKFYLTNNYYYKFNTSSKLLRRVNLSNNNVKDFTYDNIFDMVDDYILNISNKNENTVISLLSLNSSISQLVEIGYIPNV